MVVGPVVLGDVITLPGMGTLVVVDVLSRTVNDDTRFFLYIMMLPLFD